MLKWKSFFWLTVYNCILLFRSTYLTTLNEFNRSSVQYSNWLACRSAVFELNPTLNLVVLSAAVKSGRLWSNWWDFLFAQHYSGKSIEISDVARMTVEHWTSYHASVQWWWSVCGLRAVRILTVRRDWNRPRELTQPVCGGLVLTGARHCTAGIERRYVVTRRRFIPAIHVLYTTTRHWITTVDGRRSTGVFRETWLVRWKVLIRKKWINRRLCDC